MDNGNELKVKVRKERGIRMAVSGLKHDGCGSEGKQ